jgi:hypothetical protein
MFRHKKTKKRTMRKRYNKKSRKNLKGGAVPDFIAVMKSLIPANHTVSMSTGSGLPTKASTANPFIKGGKKTKKSRKNKTTQKGGLAHNASHKTWVCRGNIGCAKNINIY